MPVGITPYSILHWMNSTPDDLRLYEWERYNPRGRSPVTIGRFPQPENEKPHVIKAAQKAERECQRAAQMEAKRPVKVVQMPAP
jgi:hypothetical protein